MQRPLTPRPAVRISPQARNLPSQRYGTIALAVKSGQVEVGSRLDSPKWRIGLLALATFASLC